MSDSKRILEEEFKALGTSVEEIEKEIKKTESGDILPDEGKVIETPEKVKGEQDDKIRNIPDDPSKEKKELKLERIRRLIENKKKMREAMMRNRNLKENYRVVGENAELMRRLSIIEKKVNILSEQIHKLRLSRLSESNVIRRRGFGESRLNRRPVHIDRSPIDKRKILESIKRRRFISRTETVDRNKPDDKSVVSVNKLNESLLSKVRKSLLECKDENVKNELREIRKEILGENVSISTVLKANRKYRELVKAGKI